LTTDVVIDFRSDTVSRPTPAMRRAMAEADVGDDVFGDDPTVNELESLAAGMLGKEAAVFVPSGTMANAVASLAHLRRGDEVIVGARAHMYLNEQGQLAALSGAQAVPVGENPDGTLALDAIEALIREPDLHHPVTRLVCLENTHNECGGQPIPVEYSEAVAALAKKHGLLFHIDGARLFNAAVALKVPAAALARPADSVSFCLSKGLCAPVGSLVCGSREFVARARRARKLLGGGMRQAGVIAAAGIVALTSMIERLVNDHEHAQALARGLARTPGLVLDPAQVRTNIVYFDLAPDAPVDAPTLREALKRQDILILAFGPRRVRMVLHYWISSADVERAVQVIRDVLSRTPAMIKA
jgi:threonine aldolase